MTLCVDGVSVKFGQLAPECSVTVTTEIMPEAERKCWLVRDGGSPFPCPDCCQLENPFKTKQEAPGNWQRHVSLQGTAAVSQGEKFLKHPLGGNFLSSFQNIRQEWSPGEAWPSQRKPVIFNFLKIWNYKDLASSPSSQLHLLSDGGTFCVSCCKLLSCYLQSKAF